MLKVPSRECDAFQRVLGLAVWAQAQHEPFSFSDVRQAFGASYAGSHDAVDRKWSRDKRNAAAIGAPLAVSGGVAYTVDQRAEPARLRLGTGDAELLQALVRDLPERWDCPADRHLELGLRKLLLAGAPIRNALWDRHLAARKPAPAVGERAPRLPVLTAAEWRVRVGAILHELLLHAGRDGLAISEALVFSAARDLGDLEAVIASLLTTNVPLPAPADTLGVEWSGGRVEVYLPSRRARRIALVGDEVSALEHAVSTASSGPAAARLSAVWRAMALGRAFVS